MTQADKYLLLKDLCARLPYGVKIAVDDEVEILEGISALDTAAEYDSLRSSDIEDIKPYLFPLSSMTEEQLYDNPIGFSQMLTIKADREWENITINRRAYYKLVDWFNKNHFDYRGLISMGLANDATGLNIY
jgi:hypothetical protein